MKVFADTNVWPSGRFRPGLCAELLDALVESDTAILLDARVLDEFMRIARDKLKVDESLLALGAVQGLSITDPRTAYERLRGLD